MRRVLRLGLLVVAGYALACGPHDATTRLTFSGSALGPEGDVVRRQLARFAEPRPGVRVELQVTPDSADQRHQLYVQWLNAHAPTPDVLQLDVIWMSEFAAAGWILPLDAFEPGVDDFRQRRSRPLAGKARSMRYRGSSTWGCSTGGRICSTERPDHSASCDRWRFDCARPAPHVSGWSGRARVTKGSSRYSSSTSRRSAAEFSTRAGA